MSNSIAFLLIPAGAAVAGSILIWIWTRSRSPRQAGFQEQLQALAPREGSRPATQPSGIVRLDTPPDEER